MRLSEVTIDGKPYQLGYSFNDIADAEAIAHCNLLDAIGDLAGANATQLRGLVYAMIVPYEGMPKEPFDALKSAGDLIRMDTIAPIMQAIGEACAAAVSEELAEKYRAAVEGTGAGPEIPQTPKPATTA